MFNIKSVSNLILNRKQNFWNKFVEINDNTMAILCNLQYNQKWNSLN